MKNRIIPVEKLESLMWTPGEKLSILPEKGKNKSPVVSENFSVEDVGDRYLLRNVQYSDGLYSCGIIKSLLDGGNIKTQNEWVALTKDSEAKLGSVPDWFAIMFALYDNKEGTYSSFVEKVKDLLIEDFDPRKPWMTTSTSIVYNSSGKDKVIHNKGYETEFSIEENIAGNSGNVETGLEHIVKPICGSEDIAKIQKVIKWITGKKTYLYQINKPARDSTERAVVLGVDIVSNSFSIVVGIDVSGPARGVVVENFSVKK